MSFRLFTDIPQHIQYRIVLPLLTLIFISSVLLVIWSYSRNRGGLSHRWVKILVTLRIVALIVLLLSVLKPVIGGITRYELLGNLAIYIDNSQSMEVEDAVDDSSRLDMVKWYLFGEGKMQKRLSSFFSIDEFIFGDKVSRLEEGKTGFPKTSDSTNLVEVIDNINELARDQDLRAAIILSDGNGNVGDDDRIFDEGISIPVFCVGVGKRDTSETGKIDLGVENILSKRVILQNTKTPVNFTLNKVNISGRDVKVVVTDEENELAGAKTVTLPEGNGEYNFSMEMIAKKKGIHRYTLSVPTITGESISENNSRYFTVNVIDPKLSALYYEGRPRYELKYIRRALEESPNVHLYSIVRTSADYYYVQGTTPEIPLDKGFPDKYDELKQFSVLILGTGGTSVLTSDDISNIVRFVDDGNGLIVLGSEDLSSFIGTELEPVLPLTPAKGRIAGDFNLELTADGTRHPILEGYDEPFRSNPELSEFSGRVLTSTKKLGATVLAEGDAAPVIAVQNYGKGRVMMITADNTWQWYMRCRKLGRDSLYKKFWLQSVQWTSGLDAESKEKHFPIVFYTDKDYYNVGEKVKFDLETTEDTKDINVLFKRKGKKIADVKLDRLDEEGDKYSSSLVPEEISEYEIEVSYQGEKRSVKFIAGERLRETTDTSLNEDLLKRIAYSNGGRYFDISARSELVESLKALVLKKQEIEEELGIWDTPWPFILFVGLIGTEWFLRRWRQLI